MASDEQIKRMIYEIGRIKRQVTNLKSKIRRRTKNLEKIFNPLERQRIEFEIELLRRSLQKLQIAEIKLTLPLIKALPKSERKLEEGIDWSKAGKA